MGTNKHYCQKCGVYAMYPLEYGGKSLCAKCFSTATAPDDFDEWVESTKQAIDNEFVETEFPVAGNITSVPFDVQEKMLHYSFYDTALWLQELLGDDDFMLDIEEMAQIRLKQGYEQYGSEMYAWNDDTRRRNIMEELADIFVYRSSGRA